MAIEYIQHSAATATTGALVAVDQGDFGTATNVSVQIVKLFYGTDGAFATVATGLGYPIKIDSATATVPVEIQNTATVNVANTATVNVANTATVSLLYSATRAVPVHGFWAHDATSTGNPIYLAAISEETFPAGVSADGDVTQLISDRHGRLIIMPFGSRLSRVTAFITASATTVATLATGAGTAGVFRDLVSLVAFNSATSEARIRVRSSSTATEFIWNLAADGGGISFQPLVPWPQAIAATSWDVTLTNALTGTDALTISALFQETT